MEAPRSPKLKSHWPATGVDLMSAGMPSAEGPPSAKASASEILPLRIWMEFTHILRRSSWSPSAKSSAVGWRARRGASRPWLAVQSSCLMPSTYLVTTGGVAAMS